MLCFLQWPKPCSLCSKSAQFTNNSLLKNTDLKAARSILFTLLLLLLPLQTSTQRLYHLMTKCKSHSPSYTLKVRTLHQVHDERPHLLCNTSIKWTTRSKHFSPSKTHSPVQAHRHVVYVLPAFSTTRVWLMGFGTGELVQCDTSFCLCVSSPSSSWQPPESPSLHNRLHRWLLGCGGRIRYKLTA